MPKKTRRRLLTPSRKKYNTAKSNQHYDSDKDEQEVSTPRGRLKGALKDVLEPGADDSEASAGLLTPMKRNARAESHQSSSSDSSRGGYGNGRTSPQRYVLKLFDRSVDLSQFEEDSPLYPICRAWIANQPRMNYKKFGKKKVKPPLLLDDSVELPGPTGPVVSRIPELLPEQKQACKDNINLDYSSGPLPSREQLLAVHCARWAGVRRAWSDQAARVEARYDATQQLLNRINVSAL
ncbi:LIN37 domain-containing protein [Phthorimaea operculella]|nr:LIN37 domain-containing protein [Phthorimaea operculella]